MSTTPPPPSRNISLGSLDLTGLDLIGLDLDALTDIAESHSNNASSPDDAFAKAKRTITDDHDHARIGQRLYAESFTSGDGSGSSRRASSMSSRASESSFSSASSLRSVDSIRSLRSNKGKRLVALGLGAVEVVALSSTKKKSSNHEQANKKNKSATTNTTHRGMTEMEVSKQIRKEYLASFRATTVQFQPLTEDEIVRIAATIPCLSTLATDNLSALFDRMSAEHQHIVLKNSRRFEYEFRTRSMAGKKKSKKHSGEQSSVLLGEFMSKHVFMSKTRYLVKNGDLLFLQLFNLFLHAKWGAIERLRKAKFVNFREQLDLDMEFVMQRFVKNGNGNGNGKSSVGGKKGYWLMGLHMHPTRKLIPDSPKRSRRPKKSKKSKKTKTSSMNMSFQIDNQKHKQNWNQNCNVNLKKEELTPSNNVKFEGKSRRNSLNPSQFDEFVDESGERIWTDRKTGRRISSEDLIHDSVADPYDGWETVIDGYGTKIYIHPETGEAIVAKKKKDDSAETGRGAGGSGSVVGGATTAPRRKSLAHRAVRKVGKWLGVKKSKKKRSSGIPDAAPTCEASCSMHSRGYGGGTCITYNSNNTQSDSDSPRSSGASFEQGLDAV